MRTVNVFKITKGRIEYTDAVKAAVLNPRINDLKLHMNGGYDWVDSKYMLIKLLLLRGQIKEITTHSDLLGRQDYLDAIATNGRYLKVTFDTTTERTRNGKGDKTAGYASIKRVTEAKQRFETYLMVATSNVVSLKVVRS